MRYSLPLSALLLGVVQPSLAATIEVVVGGPGVLKFNPPFVNASVGDVVRFIMQQKNHTVTQSSLSSPCALLPGGFDTGFVPVADTVTTNYPVAELPIQQTTPIWAYCRQGNHCQQGMVFAVNPGDKFAAFQQAATGGSPAATSTSATATGSATIQPVSTNSAPAPTASAGIDHKVIVGGPGVLAYSPSNITAQVGDTITFEFHQKNHTATASSFDAPCRALALTSTTGQVGFDSGFIPVADGSTTFPTYTVRVNDTLPIWVYCRQGNHCGSGMVFSANAVESGPKNFAAFQALAKQLNGTSGTATPPASGAQSIVQIANPTYFVVVTAVLSFLFL
jgi:plastocyanin